MYIKDIFSYLIISIHLFWLIGVNGTEIIQVNNIILFFCVT